MAWTGWLSRVLVVFLVMSLVGSGPVVSVAGSSQSDGFGQQATPTENATRHEDPDRVDQDGDLAATQRWLAGRMAVQLESCTVRVGLGTTNVCEIDSDYPEWLRKYVDIAEETDDEDDDERASTFEETKDDHEEYSEAVSNFTRTYDEYQEAKEEGDDERARQLARELQRQAETVNETGERIVRDYGMLETEASVDLGEGKESVNVTVENVTETTEEVEEAEFTPTVLTAEISPREISFLTPGTIAGQLTTKNGTAVADREIDLVVGERTITTRTDGEGRFTVSYRPTTISVGTEQLTVRYRPRDESLYLGNRTTVPVSISQLEPTVDVTVESETAAFGDEVRVMGTVSADGVPARGVPVRVVVDGRTVGEVTTDGSGAFSLPIDIVAADGPGDVEVRGLVAQEDRALASSAGTAGLTVEETATALTLEPSSSGPTAVTVSGRLTTPGGEPIADQPVSLAVNGTTVETVRTDGDGTYRTQITVPSSLQAEGTDSPVRVVASYDGSGTNLRSSTANALVVLPAVSGPSDGLLDELSDSAWWIAVLVGLALAVVLVRYRERVWPGRAGGAMAGSEPSEPADTAATSETDTVDSTGFSIESARARLESDSDRAVMLAYAAVRERLTGPADTRRRRADTHWEFLAACRQDGLDDEAIEGLTDLTEAYERAAYAPASVTRADAESALDSAAGIV